jgi:hypothetical protein
MPVEKQPIKVKAFSNFLFTYPSSFAIYSAISFPYFLCRCCCSSGLCAPATQTTKVRDMYNRKTSLSSAFVGEPSAKPRLNTSKGGKDHTYVSRNSNSLGVNG